MIDELGRFLAVNGYLPHGYCISWSRPLLLTYVVSDVLIFLSYCSMPVALAYFARHRKDFPYRWLLVMFAAFILACGMTHLMGAILLWQPLYGLDALIKAATALVSVATAIVLWPLLPRALKLPSPAQLRQSNAALQSEIAERKRVEADLRRAKEAAEECLQQEQRLRAALVERTAELSAANRELDAFAYAVSHDLRAPLRAMSGFSQALAEDYGEQLQGEAGVYLEQIDIAGKKMGELINGLLTLSRSTRGELQADTVDLSALAGRLLAELAQNDPARRVATQIAGGLQVHGDARMIEVVMNNLLSNAWKYTAHTMTPAIRVYAEDRDGTRYVCVADNGAGFDMAHANRLFQPFQRLHRQEEFPGIGIGLATVQRIVHRHGGKIEALGEPGKSATFCFSLPQRDSGKDQA